MQNKGAIQVFAILLAVACIYHLSFTFVTSRVEKKAREMSGGDPLAEARYLDSMQDVNVYPLGVVSFTYAECKEREINLGLDLKGGMNVTLEVSIPDLLVAMSNKSTDSAFVQSIRIARDQQKNSTANFVDLFANAYKSINPQGRLASPLIFGHKDQDLINVKMSNEEVVAILKKESDQAIDRTFEVLNSRIDAFGVTQPNIQKLENSNRILVELPGAQDPSGVSKLLEAEARLEFYETYRLTDNGFYQKLEAANKMIAKVNAAGNTLPVADTTDSATTLTTELPDTTREDSLTTAMLDPNDTAKMDSVAKQQMSQEQFAKENPLFAVLFLYINTDEATNQQTLVPSPIVGRSLPKDTATVIRYLSLPEVKRVLPNDVKFAWKNQDSETDDQYLSLIALKTSGINGGPVLGGEVVTSASSDRDPKSNGYSITMKMNAQGSKDWAKITKENKDREVAIVMDNKVYSFPTVNGQITGGISSITGRFSYNEGLTLAAVLSAGRLPTPAKIVEQAVVGPTLGKESIRAGLLSLVIAFALILAYIAFYYGKAGMVADIALIANLFFQIGAMAALNATLTLAGITGLVLTIGMSVDANVLIFERIKEELRNGKGLRMAIADGYKEASSAIIDSNVTSLLTALILMIFGGGPVKSFAITLFIGNLTSIFSCIFLARLIFEGMLDRKKDISFWSRWSKNAFSKANINFVGRRKIFYLISGIIVAGGLASIFTKGFNLGVDLKGGRSFTVIFDNSNYTTQDVAAALTEKWGSEPIVKYYGKTDRVKIMTKYKYEESGEEVDRSISQEIYDALGKFNTNKSISLDEFSGADNGIGIVESSKTGPTVARDVRIKSLWAVALSMLLIFLYVLIRFKGWQFGVGAILALIHDIIIVLAVFSIFDNILPFSMEIDQAVIGSILTVIGYSINDKVIIFDRIREYLGIGRKGTTKTLINDAINSTLSRTLNTSLSVLLVVVTAFLFGGTAIKGLTFALLIGIIIGTYSSIFIATPMVVDLKKDTDVERK